MNITKWFTLFSLNFLMSCSLWSNEQPKPTLNKDLVFETAPQVAEPIITFEGPYKFPTFDIAALSAANIFISIYSAPLVIENGSIQNKKQIFWHWNNKMSPAIEVKFSDGKIVERVTSTDQLVYDEGAASKFCSFSKGPYYWVVWGTNSKGELVFSSTKASNIDDFYVSCVSIKRVTLEDYPLLDNNGLPWDFGAGTLPDAYLVVKDNGVEKYVFDPLNEAPKGVFWDFNNLEDKFDLPAYGVTYKFSFFDDDFTNDQLIGEVTPSIEQYWQSDDEFSFRMTQGNIIVRFDLERK